ncbi:MAG: 3-deoxy-8-phosphooctulonate synthase [Fimbriimonadaceae bacterium]|nr:3-deoxy-8-phosphooctulonate synthase [Fimbriimonadaceae bacterium]QYK54806.1 MAG: 3-deoxy-8-phosphooctulonate synthase [Fimbriimonadaceae bacterium]
MGSVEVGGPSLVVIAGPCMAESLSLCREVAEGVSQACARLGLGYVFKASFDKANRTSVDSKRGLGMEEGLRILQTVGQEFGVPTTTDVHLPDQAAAVAQAVDLLQVPAFLCRQSDLLEACAATGRPVNVKKGQFLAPHDTGNIVRKLEAFGAGGIMLTERGTTFGYNTLVVDMPGLETMRSFGWPVCFDATHSAQRPGGAGTASGGNREAIPALARAATAVGIDALFLEVHPDPDRALSDAATQWPLAMAEELLRQVVAIRSSLDRPVASGPSSGAR